MKFFKILSAVVGLISTINIVIAQDNYSLSTQTTIITGTSNLHAWHENVQKILGKGEVKQNADKTLSLQAFSIIISVNAIKSDESGMNSKTYKALKADKFPEITFILAEPIANIPLGAKAHSATAAGRLTIAGVTKTVTIPVKITLSEDKKMNVDGLQQIKMTDFGIAPPTALLGMLKTGDVVTIDFKTSFSAIN
ncbi:MAG TPA: YceI family protein [Mucilaginibacter sp.]|jgi:polyisoprenoid-binding protein YceI